MKRFIVEDDWLHDDGWQSFKKDAKGEYVVCRDPERLIDEHPLIETLMQPVSPVTLLKYVVSPFSTAFEKLGKYVGYNIPKLALSVLPEGFLEPYNLANKVKPEQNQMHNSKLTYLGVPGWCFSPQAKLAAEFAALGLSAQMFDHINNFEWTDYVVERRDDLLEILIEYKAALTKFDKGSDELTYWEAKIRKFISKAHNPNFWVPGSQLRTWWTAMMQGKFKWMVYLTYPIYYLGWFSAAKFGYDTYLKQ